MLEDLWLKRHLHRGSKEALERVYHKYLDHLLTLAMALLNDSSMAEDIVHDVFVSIARRNGEFRLRGNLKSYLTTCVVNRVRDVFRERARHKPKMEHIVAKHESLDSAEHRILGTECASLINQAIAQLPPEQRETVVLHLTAGMRLTEIAKLQKISANTVRGRYRYALQKLRTHLEKQVVP